MGANSIKHSLVLLVWAACAGAGLLSCRGTSQNSGDAGAELAGSRAEPGIFIELTPNTKDRFLAVRVRVVGAQASSIRNLRIARSWADTHGAQVITNLEAHDSMGDLPVLPPVDEGPDKVFTLSQRPRGELEFTYQARALYSGASNYALAVLADRVTSVGHAFLLLPPFTESTNTTIDWHLEALPSTTKGASSFGLGEQLHLQATSEELANAVYAAGPVQVADGPSGERMILLGEAELDVGAVFSWTLRVRGLAKQWFGASIQNNSPETDAGTAPADAKNAKDTKNTKKWLDKSFVFMLIAEPNMGTSHDGAHLTQSIALWFDAGRALDPQLRIALSHEMIHRYIGADVRLVGGGDQKEATWFSEGFTVHYARRLLFQERLISPADFAADLNRTLVGEPGREGRETEREKSYRIGALYAAYLDAALHKRSGGARSLVDLIRELLERAEERPGEAIPIEVFQEMIVRELGPEAGREFEAMVLLREREIALAEDTFGPCFGQKKAKQKVFDIGFDVASLNERPMIVRGVVKGSAAARAGVRDGGLVLSHKLPAAGDMKGRVELWLAGGPGGKKIRYRPVATLETISWKAKKCKR